VFILRLFHIMLNGCGESLFEGLYKIWEIERCFWNKSSTTAEGPHDVLWQLKFVKNHIWKGLQ